MDANNNSSTTEDAMSIDTDIGACLWCLLESLYSIPRTLLGHEVEASLDEIEKIIPIKRYAFSSGTSIGSWTIPDCWVVNEASIKKMDGTQLIDYNDNPMHLWQYSTAINSVVSRESLLEVLATKPEAPEGIPHVVTYYKQRWGFSVTEEQKSQLTDDRYQVSVNTEFKKGALTIGELTIPGESAEVIVIDAVISCPGLANNVSGMVVAVYLAKMLLSGDRPYFTYRFLFTPETLGPLTVGHKMPESIERVVGGYTLINLSDEKGFHYKRSRSGNTVADIAMMHALRWSGEPYTIQSFDVRTGTCGNEKAYNSLGLEIPIGSISRSPLGSYPEYDTSLDNLDFVCKKKLLNSYQVCRAAIQVLERSQVYRHQFVGEPFLTGYRLFPKIEQESDRLPYDYLMGFTTGQNTLVDIANLADLPVQEFDDALQKMLAAGLLEQSR